MNKLFMLVLFGTILTSCKEGEQGPAGLQGPPGEQGLPGSSPLDSLASFYELTLEAARPINSFLISNSPSNPSGTTVWSDLDPNISFTWVATDGFLVITVTYPDGFETYNYPLTLIRQMNISTVGAESLRSALLYY